MDSIVSEIFTQWGVFGVVFLAAIYIIWDSIKSRKNQGNANKKLDAIIDDIIDIKSDIPDIKSNVQFVEKEINCIDDKLETKINSVKEVLNARIDSLEEKVEEQPNHIIYSMDTRKREYDEIHSQQMLGQITKAPLLHKIMGIYMDRIKCDHIFLGSFHNGKSTVTGIPYYKFDIVAEKFNPLKIERDCEFAHLYQDVDVLRHDKLPIELVQNEYVYYTINEDKSSELESIDDILYRRMVGRDIKQLAINLLHDSFGNPLGFVGCVKYDYENIDQQELRNCACELEIIYNKN